MDTEMLTVPPGQETQTRFTDRTLRDRQISNDSKPHSANHFLALQKCKTVSELQMTRLDLMVK